MAKSVGSLLVIVAAAIGLAHSAAGNELVRGVNLAGGDFGAVPGVYGTDYIYPTEAEIDGYAKRGFSIIRVPFRWERIQRTLNGPLDESGDFKRIQDVVGWITERKLIAILDMHNYARRNIDGANVTVGSDVLPVAALADIWVRLADTFKADDRVWFGLMNEPFDIPAQDWKTIAQTVTDAIRASGARNMLLVPGTAYTGAHTWVSSGNAQAMADFADPAGNFAFEVHQYLDADSSGKSGTCVPGAGATRLKPFIDWAKAAAGRKGFLAEFAAGDPSIKGQEQCAAELAALLDAAESSGVFIGWTAWGGGAWWPQDYIFRLDPQGPDDSPSHYMDALVQRLR